LAEEVAAYRQLYSEWRRLAEEIRTLEGAAESRRQRREWLATQLAQVPLQLSVEAYQALEVQVRRLENQHLMASTVSQWMSQLSEGLHNPIALLSQAVKSLQRLPGEEKALSEAIELLEGARYSVQEGVELLSRLLEAYAIDAAQAESIQAQYDLYNHLMLRFQVPTVELLLETIQRYQTEYEVLTAEETAVGPALEKFRELTERVLDAAYKLELGRLAAAQTLSDEVERYMSELGLRGARFQVSVERLTSTQSDLSWQDQPVELTANGFSRVVFLIQTNPGFPLAPLAQVASGGEASRVMLALKAALAEKVQLPTLILDEIDTGLSGEAAQRMGRFLAHLSRKMQVILITHLPVIAAQPGRHFRIEKVLSGDGLMETRVQALSEAERVGEVARLLSGDAWHPEGREVAQSLLSGAGAI